MVMELWTAATPNGWKVNIMVEELIELGISIRIQGAKYQSPKGRAIF